MKVHVESWDPTYGSAFEPGEPSPGPSQATTSRVEIGVELPPDAWRPLLPPEQVRPPATVLLVDGVRRIDGRIWVEDSDGTHPGVAASYAAGVVRCDLQAGVAEVIVTRVERGLFTSSTRVGDLVAATGAVYRPHRVSRPEPMDLQQAVQRRMRELEMTVAAEARSRDSGGDDLLVVDGPLHGRTHLDRTVGYIKTHRTEYLPPALAAVVTSLPAGHRSPVFLLGTSWDRYAWYLRLPGAPGSPWAGVVRVECTADVSRSVAIQLADISTVTLPRFASAAYKDPRAPQNLVPISGLERRLRSLLGDARLLNRALRAAVAG